MNEEELKKIWQSLDTRITTLNERTKIHTLQIKELEKKLRSPEYKKYISEIKRVKFEE